MHIDSFVWIITTKSNSKKNVVTIGKYVTGKLEENNSSQTSKDWNNLV